VAKDKRSNARGGGVVSSTNLFPGQPAGLRPNPTDLPQTINPEGNAKRAGVETHRNLNCHLYDGCLNEAVKRGWQSFTCAKCPLAADVAPPQMGIEAYATQRRAI
jgi:hypothetical protein